MDNQVNHTEVSVVIPTYNASGFVGRAIESAITQGRIVKEIICVDDNSTDNTKEIIETYRIKFPDIIKKLVNTGKGACAARNMGWRMASCDWIQFLDADDELLPDKLQHQCDLLNKRTDETFLIAGSYRTRYDSGRETEHVFFSQHPVELLFFGKLGNTCANLWSKKALETVGGWGDNIESSQETELMFRLLDTHAQAGIILDPVRNTRIYSRSEGSISTRDESGNWDRIMQLRLFYLQKWKTRMTENMRNTVLQKMFELLMMYYRIHRKNALKLYDEIYRDERFKVKASGLVRRYFVILLRLVGFANAMRIQTLLRK